MEAGQSQNTTFASDTKVNLLVPWKKDQREALPATYTISHHQATHRAWRGINLGCSRDTDSCAKRCGKYANRIPNTEAFGDHPRI